MPNSARKTQNDLAEALERHKGGMVQAGECPNVGECQMFPLLNLAGNLQTWKTRYCTGDFVACERLKRTKKGQTVPPDLMPNGVRLSARKG